MKLETFLEKFDRFADAPGAVEKMRELVLGLAVRGRLVKQSPSEGDAASLLETLLDARNKGELRKSINEPGTVALTEVEGWHQVPASWRWVRLEAVGEIVGGGTPRSDNSAFFAAEGIPWLTPADLNGFKGKRISRGRRCITQAGLEASSARLLPAGSVLFSSRAPIGYVAIAGVALATNQGFKSCIPFIPDMNEFLYYYLISAAARIDRQASGTTFREVSGKLVGQIPVPIPPLAEQKRIVAKVDELMALCDRLEAQQRERETRHAALARAALARFDGAPTGSNFNLICHQSYDISPADLRGTVLALAVCGGLSERRNGFSSWPTVALREVCLQITDGEHATPQRTPSGVPLATAKNVRDGFLDLTTTDYVAQSTAEKCWKRCKPRDQDILMVCVGATTGRVCLAHDPPDIVLVRSVALLRPDTSRVFPPFLDRFLRSPTGQSQIWGGVKQSAQPCLYLGKMAEFQLLLPPLAEQHRIVAKVDQLMALVDQLEAQLEASQATGEKLLEAVVAELTFRA